MLKQSHFSSNEQIDGGFDGKTLMPRQSTVNILAAVRRQLWVVVVSVAVFIALGILYLIQTIPQYTSSVSILIDSKKAGLAASTAIEGSLTFETGAVDSQVQILLSYKLATMVATRLNLQNNMAFLNPPKSVLGAAAGSVTEAIGKLTAKLAGNPPGPKLSELPENLRLILAAQLLESNLKATRVGRTYVLNVEYTDQDPALAQAIAGQYASAYLEDQLDSKFDATKRASNWMEERIRELRQRSLDADAAVQRYRSEHNLTAASGRLIDEQALTDATTQLAIARGELDTASAKYQRLKDIIDSKDYTGSMTESLGNPNVGQLRAKYLLASKTNSEISAKYGPDHQTAVNARKDMVQYQQLIYAELTNLLPSLQSDVAISQTKVSNIQQTINQLRQASTSNNEAMVKLRGLEQEADTLKTLYTNFLQKQQETQQQESFPVTDARIISDAAAPLIPSSPKKSLILTAAFLLGGMIGCGIGALREWRDRGFRTSTQIRDELGLEFITNIPLLSNQVIRPGNKKGEQLNNISERVINNQNASLSYSILEPFSQFSEAIRAIKARVNLDFPKKKGVVIGFVSLFPNEGKSTLAKNFASSSALQGSHVLLLDGDLRNPSLTRDLANNSRAGILDVINVPDRLPEVLFTEERSGLHFLPGAPRQRSGFVHDMLGSEKAFNLIDDLRSHYDLIVVDFPPVGALNDALAASPIVDGYIFVVEWGRTPRTAVQEMLQANPELAEKSIGVVLNKVDLGSLKKYTSFYGETAYTQYKNIYFS